MDCSQNNYSAQLPIELGILPCLGILLLLFGLFFLFVKCLSRDLSPDKPEQYSDDDAVVAFVALISSIVFLLVASAFLVGAILVNIMNSTLNGQPIHWF